MPSTAFASLPVATVSSARRQPDNLCSTDTEDDAEAEVSSGYASSNAGRASRVSVSFAVSRQSRRASDDTALPIGRSSALATAAMGDPNAVAVAARRPGVPPNFPGVSPTRPGVETDFPTSAEASGAAPTAPPPTSAPARIHALGVPSFCRAISLDAFVNLSSSASLTSAPTRPMWRHASSPATLYATVKQFSAAARVGASLASASLAISTSALDPPLSTTSRPWRSTSSSRASRASRRVFVFFESKPRTKYPASRDAGNKPGTVFKTPRNFSRAASIACPLLSTSAGRNSAPSCSESRPPWSLTDRNTDCVKSSTFKSDCVLGVCSLIRRTTHRSNKSRLPCTFSGVVTSACSSSSIAMRWDLKS
mmetsp:Transcript_5001/g.18658  ORF Transcript_5001/g.18658 Transcript_5001/m.18658 type:complete len:366 (-) Transcript_5001:3711-4808(-)